MEDIRGLNEPESWLSACSQRAEGTSIRAPAVRMFMDRSRVRHRIWAAAAAMLLLLPLGCTGGSGSSSDGSPGSTLFLASDGQLTVVNVDEGKTRVLPLPELAPGDPSYRLLRRDDRLVFWGGNQSFAGDAYLLDTDLDSSPKKLGDSWFFIPSEKPDRIWLALRDRSEPGARLREVSVDGEVTHPDIMLPDGRYPAAAVGESLVFEDGRGALELWHVDTRRFTRRFEAAHLGPTQGSLLTWCERGGHHVHVADVETGKAQVLRPPQGAVAYDCSAGDYAPRAGVLAIAVVADGEPAKRALALIDIDKSAAVLVANSSVAADYLFVTWSSNGERVFFSGGAERRILLEYRMNEPQAVRLRIDVHDFYAMVAE